MAFRATMRALSGARSALSLGRAVGLTSFVRQVFTARAIIDSDLRDLQAAIAKFFIRKVVPRTPIDTGRLRSNWQIGINRIPRTLLVSVDKSARRGKHEANPRAVSSIVIAKAVNTLRALPVKAVVHVVNTADYIVERNKDGGTRGRNRGRPAAFIERTIKQTNAKFGFVTDVTGLE